MEIDRYVRLVWMGDPVLEFKDLGFVLDESGVGGFLKLTELEKLPRSFEINLIFC